MTDSPLPTFHLTAPPPLPILLRYRDLSCALDCGVADGGDATPDKGPYICGRSLVPGGFYLRVLRPLRGGDLSVQEATDAAPISFGSSTVAYGVSWGKES